MSLREIPLWSGLKGELALWARNILDKKYENVGLDFGAGFGGLRTAFYGDPRTFGADFTVSW